MNKHEGFDVLLQDDAQVHEQRKRDEALIALIAATQAKMAAAFSSDRKFAARKREAA